MRELRIRVQFGKYVAPWFDLLMVSKEETKEILGGTGWRVKEFMDSEGSSYVAVIEKEKPA